MRQRTWALLSVLVAVPLAIVAGPARAADSVLIDDFEGSNGWTVTRAPGSRGDVVWEVDDSGQSCVSTTTSATAPAS